MRSPQLIKAGEKVFYATEDYTKDYENDSAYNARFVMLDGDKRVDLISENADTEDFMGVYNAYEKIFSYGSKLAVIIKQTPDMQLVTYEDDNKKSEKYIYSDDRQAIYIYDVTTSELKQFQSDKEVEFSCFVDENTLYAIDTSIKIVDDMLFDTETGEFKQVKNDDYFYGYNTCLLYTSFSSVFNFQIRNQSYLLLFYKSKAKYISKELSYLMFELLFRCV